MPQQQQQQLREKRRTRPLAEIRVRDANMKMQQQLQRENRRFQRDLATWDRDYEKSSRNLLQEFAHMMDAKLTPSVDDWFAKRRIRQVSCLPDRRRSRATGGDAGDDDEFDDGEDASALRELDRLKILEAKSNDWLGVTSVPFSVRLRPQTAAATQDPNVAAAAAAAAAASAAAGGSSEGSDARPKTAL